MKHVFNSRRKGIIIFSMIFLNSMVLAQSYYLGNNQQGCICHNSNQTIDKWSQTAHATAHSSLAEEASFGYSCLSCHNTGWDETVANYGADEYVQPGDNNSYTITDETNFQRVSNVQCETCHGPLAKEDGTFLGFNDHQQAAVIDYSADNCGSCHEGSHHPTFSDWKKSLHAVAKKTSIPGGAFDFIASNAECAACHTAEGFLQFVEQDGWVPNVEAPGDAGHDITCAACHDPHSTENSSQLRLPKAQICAKCHNPEYNPEEVGEPDGSEVHHATAFMFEGKGGYEYEGVTYNSSAHTFALTDKCVTCHVFKTEFQAGPPEIPAYTGHSFEPHLESCVTCHNDFSPSDSSFDYRSTQTQITAKLEELHALLAAASSADSATAAFKRAKFNYDFVESDGSHGIHNTKYATALLESSIANFTPSSVNERMAEIPQQFTLAQNYPNPFNPSTVIEFGLPITEDVTINIYDVRGSLVATLLSAQAAAGYHKVEWNGRDSNGNLVSAGAYFYRLETASMTLSKKMMLLK